MLKYSFMHQVVFVLHSTACHWISILKRDKRQLTIRKKKNTQSLSAELVFEMEIRTLADAERIVYINLLCPTCLQHRACCNIYLPFSFSFSTRVNNADAMNKTCPQAHTRSCFVRRASFHIQGFNWFHFYLQLMRLVYYEWMSVTWHYQLSAPLSVITCMLKLPHTVYCSELNWSSAWPWFVSTKWLTWVLIGLKLLSGWWSVSLCTRNAGCIKMRRFYLNTLL